MPDAGGTIGDAGVALNEVATRARAQSALRKPWVRAP